MPDNLTAIEMLSLGGALFLTFAGAGFLFLYFCRGLVIVLEHLQRTKRGATTDGC